MSDEFRSKIIYCINAMNPYPEHVIKAKKVKEMFEAVLESYDKLHCNKGAKNER